MKLPRVLLPLFLLADAAMAHSVTQVVVLDPIAPSASPGQTVSVMDSAGCRYSGRLGRTDAPNRAPLDIAMKPTPHSDRIFIGTYSTGISFADRVREKNGDYAPLAFLSFDTLDLRMERDCLADLVPAIAAYASTIQAQRGMQLQISAAGQTVILGTAASNN